MTALLREAWERFWLYFPWCSWVLWRLGPTGWCAAPHRCRQRGDAPQHEPDYFMRDFRCAHLR